MEKAYIEILNLSPREGMAVIEDRAFNFLSAKKAEYRKMLNHMSEHDRHTNVVKKLRSCYQDICLSLKRHKDKETVKNDININNR